MMTNMLVTRAAIIDTVKILLCSTLPQLNRFYVKNDAQTMISMGNSAICNVLFLEKRI